MPKPGALGAFYFGLRYSLFLWTECLWAVREPWNGHCAAGAAAPLLRTCARAMELTVRAGDRVSVKPGPRVTAVLYLGIRAVPAGTPRVLGLLIPGAGQEILHRQDPGLIRVKGLTLDKMNDWIPATSTIKSSTGAGAFQVGILPGPDNSPRKLLLYLDWSGLFTALINILWGKSGQMLSWVVSAAKLTKLYIDQLFLNIQQKPLLHVKVWSCRTASCI